MHFSIFNRELRNAEDAFVKNRRMRVLASVIAKSKANGYLISCMAYKKSCGCVCSTALKSMPICQTFLTAR